jgi:glucose-1-phosphate thymidylyltransferase
MVRKAVITAGGLATRLHPISEATNKHMLPVYDRPMIQLAVETVVASGITDILVQLTNTFAQPVMQLLKDGSAFDCSIYYSYRPMGDGVAKGLANARRFTAGEPFLLMLGDSWYREPLDLSALGTPHLWAMPLNGFDDFRKYAEVTLDAKRRVIDITERPEQPRSNLIATGAWIFPPDVFGLAEQLVRESEKEVQVRSIIRAYVEQGDMRATILPPRSFLDLGTFEALHLASSLVREQRLQSVAAG